MSERDAVSTLDTSRYPEPDATKLKRGYWCCFCIYPAGSEECNKTASCAQLAIEIERMFLDKSLRFMEVKTFNDREMTREEVNVLKRFLSGISTAIDDHEIGVKIRDKEDT